MAIFCQVAVEVVDVQLDVEHDFVPRAVALEAARTAESLGST